VIERYLLGLDGVTVSVSKSTITFKGRGRGFAGARPSRRGVQGYLDLTRRLDGDPRIRSVTPYTKRLSVHQYLVTSERSTKLSGRGSTRHGASEKETT
jgi:hypothetical protein